VDGCWMGATDHDLSTRFSIFIHIVRLRSVAPMLHSRSRNATRTRATSGILGFVYSSAISPVEGGVKV